MTYFDDGIFKLRTFSKLQRSEEEIQQNEIDFNSLFSLDQTTMVTDDFPDPYIACTFVTDSILFINFFLNQWQLHYHFLWCTRQRKVVSGEGRPTVYDLANRIKVDASAKGEARIQYGNKNFRNFPIKCFFVKELG